MIIQRNGDARARTRGQPCERSERPPGGATAYATDAAGGAPLKRAEVRGAVFEPLGVPPAAAWPRESISANYEMRPGDGQPRDPIFVYDYNDQAGNDFRVYYSHEAPGAAAPCHEVRPDIGGWVCK